jgi:glycosyltransferase involved in cell wall biosynthesis
MFGIVNVEALACGCPVIGWAHATETSAINHAGGEIIDDGKHGFLNVYTAYTEEERERTINNAVELLKRVPEIDRNACRQRYLDRFTAKRMAEKTVSYYNIIKSRGRVHNVTEEL